MSSEAAEALPQTWLRPVCMIGSFTIRTGMKAQSVEDTERRVHADRTGT